jgi:RHS repeat-associated protein
MQATAPLADPAARKGVVRPSCGLEDPPEEDPPAGGSAFLPRKPKPGSPGGMGTWKGSGNEENPPETPGREGCVTVYGYRYFDPQLGRWLSRDPIGERGGINLYEFAYNNPYRWIDILGREPLPTLGIEIQMDNTVPRESNMRRDIFLNSHLDTLKKHIKCCCQKWPETCVELDITSSLGDHRAPANNNYPRNNDALPRLTNNGKVPIIVTNARIGGLDSEILGIANTNLGAIIRLSSPGYVLAHELGHSAGFEGNAGPDDPTHDRAIDGDSGENDSLMAPEGGQITPIDWCKKIHELATNLTKKANKAND